MYGMNGAGINGSLNYGRYRSNGNSSSRLGISINGGINGGMGGMGGMYGMGGPGSIGLGGALLGAGAFGLGGLGEMAGTAAIVLGTGSIMRDMASDVVPIAFPRQDPIALPLLYQMGPRNPLELPRGHQGLPY